LSFVRLPSQFSTKGDTTGIFKEPFHVSDWFPTLIGLMAKTSENEEQVKAVVPYNIDGIDLSDSLLHLSASSPQKERGIFLQIDDSFPHTKSIAYREGDWKLIMATTNDPTIYNEPYDNWMNGQRTFIDKVFEILCDFLKNNISPSDDFLSELFVSRLRYRLLNVLGWQPPSNGVFLFNLINDPTESHNLADIHPGRVKSMQEKIENEKLRRPKQGDWQAASIKGMKHDQYYPEYPGISFWGPFLDENEDIFEDPTLNLPKCLLLFFSFTVTFPVIIGLLIICCLIRTKKKIK